MKTYMVISLVDGEQGVSFADHWEEATDIARNIECGLGGYAEIYGRDTHEDEEEDKPAEYVMIEC